MASSVVDQLTPLFILLGLAAIVGALHLMYGLPRWLYWKSGRAATQQRRMSQADEEQGSANPCRRSWVSLDNLPRSRSSSTAAMVPNAVPPTYISRTCQVGFRTAALPRPLRHPPSLDHRYSPAPFPQQQSLPGVLLFVLADESTDTLGIRSSSLQHPPSRTTAPFAKDSRESLEPIVLPLAQSPVQTRIPFANDLVESVEPEVAEVLSPVSTSTYFPAPAATPTRTDILPLRKPISMSLQTGTITGTVQAHKPRLVCPANRESDTTAGNFVSNVVKSMESLTSTKVSSRTEESGQGEWQPNPSFELSLCAEYATFGSNGPR